MEVQKEKPKSKKGRPKLDTAVIREELSKYPKILFSRRQTLPERLAIAFRPVSTGDNPSAVTRQRNAHLIYREVLRTHPHAFLPFIITTSPRACEGHQVQDFFDKSGSTEKSIVLDPDAKLYIEKVALKGGFNKDGLYKEWIKVIFREPEDKRQKYSQLSTILISDLGDSLSDTIKSSCQWSREQKKGLITTGCLTVWIPWSKHHDISVTIVVGHEFGIGLIDRIQYKNFTFSDPKGRIQDLFILTYMLTATDKRHTFSKVAINQMGILSSQLLDALLDST